MKLAFVFIAQWCIDQWLPQMRWLSSLAKAEPCLQDDKKLRLNSQNYFHLQDDKTLRLCFRRCFCLPVCLLPTAQKLRTDLHEIFREGWQWANDKKD